MKSFASSASKNYLNYPSLHDFTHAFLWEFLSEVGDDIPQIAASHCSDSIPKGTEGAHRSSAGKLTAALKSVFWGRSLITAKLTLNVHRTWGMQRSVKKRKTREGMQSLWGSREVTIP